MNGEWCIFNNRWSSEYCDSIVKRTEKYSFYQAHIGNDKEGVVDVSGRKSRVKFIHHTDQDFKDVFNDLWLAVSEANEKYFKFHISKLDSFQLTEYNAEYLGEYKKHKDVFWLNNDPYYHRKLSCVVQLTNPQLYTGGDLVLEDLEGGYPNIEQVRNQGSITYFPSFVSHAVTPVTSGIRHSLVAWFDGPKWR